MTTSQGTKDIALEVSEKVAGAESRAKGRPRKYVSPPAAPLIHESVVGTVLAVVNSARALVACSRILSGTAMARCTVPLGEKDVGQQAVLVFEGGDPAKAIVLGIVRTPDGTEGNVTVDADGDKFVVIADREIELRCGAASITLTRAGKVIIKGEYVMTRAKGVNRIKGASVSIN